jgi:hypothetical protein
VGCKAGSSSLKNPGPPLATLTVLVLGMVIFPTLRLPPSAHPLMTTLAPTARVISLLSVVAG